MFSIMGIMDEITKKENAKRVHKEWVAANLDKMAIINRRSYDKKKQDPEYRQLLVMRTTAYRQRVKEAKLVAALTLKVVDASTDLVEAQSLRRSLRKTGGQESILDLTSTNRWMLNHAAEYINVCW